MAQGQADTTGYGFDNAARDERRRLALIEEVYDPPTTAILAGIGVAGGWHCLEVGTGGGSIARWLRDRVGDGGRVVAADLDPRFVDGERGIEARRLNLLEDDLEQGAFDLVHCRLLLHHLRGRQLDAVRRLAGALRPGGTLLVSECFFGGMVHSGTPAYASAWRAFAAAMPNADYDWPPALASTLCEAGLVDVQTAGEAEVVRGGTPPAELLRLTLATIRPRMPDHTVTDAAMARLADPDALEPGIVWYRAWGRRPG